MAQSGYTPILIYASGTAAALPSAANLTSSANGAELALNYADGKLYYKNSSGVVTLLANAATAAGSPPGGSNTQVQYNNSGAFGGSANFVWDNSNVRLGIGTSSPNNTLAIYQATTPILQLGNSTTTVNAGSGLQMYITGLDSTIINQNAGYLRFGTSGIERMRIDSSGNVGIGTTPSYTLHVNGLTYADNFRVPNTTGFFYDIAGQNGLYIYGTTHGSIPNTLSLNTNGSERMRITSAGNVGIGTSSPGYRLTVDSNTLIYTDSVSSNNYSLTNGGTNYGGGVAPYLTVAGAGGSYGYLLIKGGNGGTSNTANIGLANKNSSGNYILGALLGCEVTTATAGSESQFFKIATQDAGTGVADRIRITNANLYLTSQTTTSSATVFSIAAYQNGYPATGQYGSIDFVNGNPWYSGGRIVFKTNGNADITNTSPTERARISSTGGFSVGTTADPGAGAIYATGNITAYYSDARLKDVKGTIANALDKVSSLSGVYYTNNEVAVAHGYTSAETQVGLLAQDVEAVLPEVVKAAPFDLDERGDSKSGEHYKTVQYERIIPLLVEAIKELRAEVKALRG